MPCAVCAKQSAHVELASPGELPAGWTNWDRRRQESHSRHHDAGRWRFVYDGPAAGSGDGHDIDASEVARITAAFSPPVRAFRVHNDAGFYYNTGLYDWCDMPYCSDHRHVNASGTGTCPQSHSKSLDPHWSPV